MSKEYKRPDEVKVKGFDTEIRELDKAAKTEVAYVSTMTKDSYNEVVLPVFNFDRFNKNNIVLWAHESWTPPIGKAHWVRTDDKGLIAKTEFQTGTQFGKDIWALVSEGFLKAYSIGYWPKRRVRPDNDDWQSLLEEWAFDETAVEVQLDNELWEYSKVPVPANPDAVAAAITQGVVKSARLRKDFEACLDKTIEKAISGSGGDSGSGSNKEVIALLREISGKLDKALDPKQRVFLYQEALAIEKSLKQKSLSKPGEAEGETSGTSPASAKSAEATPPEGYRGSRDVSGGAPGTRETVVDYTAAKAMLPGIVEGAVRRLQGKVS